jgi:hypothetical protein
MLTQLEVQTALATIRRKESEMAQRLLAAQKQATQEVAQARQAAQAMMAQAGRDGQRAGEAERQAMLTAIEQEAEAILVQAQVEADRWQEEGEKRRETAVIQLITLVCGYDVSVEEGEGLLATNGYRAREEAFLRLRGSP